jgi:hypothetical protein
MQITFTAGSRSAPSVAFSEELKIETVQAWNQFTRDVCRRMQPHLSTAGYFYGSTKLPREHARCVTGKS